MEELGKIIVIGSGNWGTTLAMVFSQKHKVYLWTINEQEAADINKTRESQFLPDIKLPDNIIVEKKFTRQIEQNDIVITAIPSRFIEALTDEFLANNAEEFIIVNASKGVELFS